MNKKWLICLLCMVLLFSFAVSAETTAENETTQEEMPFTPGQRPSRGGGMQPPEMQEGGQPPQLQGGMQLPQRQDGTVQQPSEEQEPQRENESGQLQESLQNQIPQQGGGMMQRPDMMQDAAQQSSDTEATTPETQGTVDYLTLTISLLLLAGAFVFVIFYRRKTY